MACTVGGFKTQNAPQITKFKTWFAATWPNLTEQVLLDSNDNYTDAVATAAGNCMNVCGSGRIVELVGLESMSLSTEPLAVAYVACTYTPYVTLSWDLDPTAATAVVQLRATGLGAVWPTTSSQLEYTSNVTATGSVIITVPWAIGSGAQNFHWDDASVSVNVWLSVPDVPNGMPEPLQAFGHAVLARTTAQFQERLTLTLRTTMSKALTKRVRASYLNTLSNGAQAVTNAIAARTTMTCQQPAFTKQSCSTNTVGPTGPCHPCDTCCNCAMRQSCDGDCVGCACLACGPPYATVQWLWVTTAVLAVCVLVWQIVPRLRRGLRP